MKILQCTHQCLPNHIGGVEVFVHELSRTLLTHGHEVRVLSGARESNESQHAQFEGVDITYVPKKRPTTLTFEQHYRDADIDSFVGQQLDDFQPDIVHVHHLLQLSTGILSEISRRGIPSVLTLHDFWLQCHFGQRIKPKLHERCTTIEASECAKCISRQNDVENMLPKVNSRIAYIERQLSNVTVFTGPSRFILDEFERWGIPKERTIYLDYGFDPARFYSLAKKKCEQMRFAFVGRVVPTKGVHVLAQAAMALDSDQFRVDIYGPLDSRPEYVSQLLEITQDDDRITIHGQIAHNEVAKLYETIDVLVVPSLWFENSPLTIHEAFLAKTPVFASNIGGMREYVEHNINGVLFAPGDAIALGNAMAAAVENPAAIRQMSKNMPSVNTIEDVAEEFEKVYTRISHKFSR